MSFQDEQYFVDKPNGLTGSPVNDKLWDDLYDLARVNVSDLESGEEMYAIVPHELVDFIKKLLIDELTEIMNPDNDIYDSHLGHVVSFTDIKERIQAIKTGREEP